ncbi:MAG: hypothetical protein DM484_23330 [Candidatus Methylumidiphilus alinenensis]|uniref:Heparinase II/III-like C-terminal domain-containing protein n=1 Tax=Candidatus Methylumidiphilus alinenensis TaxID=2202197 RepID=A0A2W4QM46_9GAMM|nr:MAG: hypothetical protein DM484_23330 [Candidatus Methylumidiphilus alinenensis]
MAVMCHPDGEISFFNDAAIGIAPSPTELEEYAVRLCQSMDAVFRLENPPYTPLKKMNRGGNTVDTAVHSDDRTLNSTALGREGGVLVPKLRLGNAALEAPASGVGSSWSLQDKGSQAGAWEPAQKGGGEGLVPKLRLGNAVLEAPASGVGSSWSLQDKGSQAGAWEPAQTGAWKPAQSPLTPLLQRGGYYVYLAESGYIRVCWGNMVALLDVAPIGPDYLPGHAHADTLSFELSLFGQRVLVNSGTSCYGMGPERLMQRGTATHNTVAINGKDSSEVWGGFRVARRARPFGLRIEESENSLKVVCAHDGYTRLPGRPIHRREWRISEGAMEIVDTIEGGFDEAVGRLFFHPGLSLEPNPNVIELATAVGRNKSALAGVYGELTGRMPETVVARPYSGLHPTLDSTALNPPPVGEGTFALNSPALGGGEGYVDGMGEIRLYWQVEGAESRIVQTAYHPEFGLDVPNQCLEMRFYRSVCKLRLTWDGPSNSHFEHNRAGLEPAPTN